MDRPSSRERALHLGVRTKLHVRDGIWGVNPLPVIVTDSILLLNQR
jgi:hypothetical protein